jgi:hypothetical protein
MRFAVQPTDLFSLSSPIVLIGWLALLAAPLAPKWTDRIAGLAIPALLSVAYTALIMAFWSGAKGGFDSLENVMMLFTQPEIALAGWLHYLAFDLFVGAWEVRTARQSAMPHWLVLPCLPLTFLFGPAGFVLFLVLKAGHATARAGSQTEGVGV